jgi:hypothetical protein
MKPIKSSKQVIKSKIGYNCTQKEFDMVREIIKPTSENYNLVIPKEYLNQEIEILVLPFSIEKRDIEDNSEAIDIFKKTSGLLKSKNIDPIKWQRESRNDRKI